MFVILFELADAVIVSPAQHVKCKLYLNKYLKTIFYVRLLEISCQNTAINWEGNPATFLMIQLVENLLV